MSDTIKYSRYELFDTYLTAANGEEIVSIYEPGITPEESHLKRLGYQIIRNSFIRDLRGLVGVKSISEIEIPEGKLSSPVISREMKNVIINNLEWTSQRKHLNLWSGGIGRPWRKRATVSLFNRGPAPDYPIDLLAYYTGDLALPLGGNGRIGVSIQNVNFGALAGDDFVNVTGNYVEDIIALPPAESTIEGCTPEGWILNTESQVILSTDSQRKYFVLTNKSNADVFVHLGEQAELDKGIYLVPNTGSYEFNGSIDRYRGPVSAVASAPNSLLTGIACR